MGVPTLGPPLVSVLIPGTPCGIWSSELLIIPPTSWEPRDPHYLPGQECPQGRPADPPAQYVLRSCTLGCL